MLTALFGIGSVFVLMIMFGLLGLLVEWIAYRMEVKEHKKVKAAVWRLREKDEDWRRKKCQ